MPLKSLLLHLTFLTAAAALPHPTPAAPPTATGPLHPTFTERSPLSSREIAPYRLDWDPLSTAADLADLDYDLANESFDLVVPATYRAGAPHGLLVWTGVTGFSPEWLPVLARHRLIFVSANNTKDRLAMYTLPLDAAHNLRKTYNIDAARVYLCGFSRGGALATRILRAYPDVFRGGLFLLGGDFYYHHTPPAGPPEPTVLPQLTPTWKGPLDSIKTGTAIVLMKGQRDPQWTSAEGKADHQALTLDGFTRATYLEVPNLGHNHPSAPSFERGIIALEAKPTTPPTTRPTTQPHPLPSQLAQARRLLATALYQLDEKTWKTQWVKDRPQLTERIRTTRQESARHYLQQTITDYPTTPAATEARRLLARLSPPTTSPTTKPTARAPADECLR
jgi:predicted esterase